MKSNLKFMAMLLTVLSLMGFTGALQGSVGDSHLGIWLARDLSIIERYNANPTENNRTRVEKLLNHTADDPVLLVYLHMHEPPAGTILSELEIRVEKLYPHTWIPPVGVHPTGYLIAEIKYSEIRSLIEDKLVERITAAYRRLKPLNDQAALYTGAAAAWELDPPITGEGVRLAILDSGFQLDHPDLPEPAAAMDYSEYPDSSEDVTDQRSGHGTHVAGTAFGRGTLSEGRWRGMAPEAEAVYLKIGDDSTTDASSAAVVGALRGAATWCHADIASMSYGGSDGINDGTTAEDQAVDWAVGQGMTVFMSAGNAAQDCKHYYGRVNAGEQTDPIQIVIKNAPEYSFWSLSTAWFDGADEDLHVEMSTLVRDSDGNELDADDTGQISTPRGTEARILTFLEPLPADSTSYFVTVTNQSETDQDFHLYIFSSHWYVRFLPSNADYTAHIPSIADSCISVAAFTSRSSWTDYLGDFHDDRTTVGMIANFSSRGPRIDGVLKPEITGPGKRVISCRNTDTIDLEGSLAYVIISNNGESGEPADYLALMGTSMSCPATAGAAALMLQADPDLTPSQLQQRIYRSAQMDDFTGNTPNNIWGWGKVDVIQALGIADSDDVIVAIPQEIVLESVDPNPFNSAFILQYSIPVIGQVNIGLYDLTGREVWSVSEYVNNPGRYRVTVPKMLVTVGSGTYIIRIGNKYGSTSKNLTLLK